MNCEKCGNMSEFDTKYHIGNAVYPLDAIGDVKISGPRCTFDQCNQHDGEHLHITCSICGYDWVKPTEDSDNRKRK